MDSRESESTSFSSDIVAMMWLVLELLINLNICLRRHYLNYLFYNGHFFIFLSINSFSPSVFWVLPLLVCLLLVIIVKDMWDIKGLGKIKRFMLSLLLWNHKTYINGFFIDWWIVELVLKKVSHNLQKMIWISFSILITAFETFRLILIMQNNLYWWSCPTDSSIYQFDLLIFYSFTLDTRE